MICSVASLSTCKPKDVTCSEIVYWQLTNLEPVVVESETQETAHSKPPQITVVTGGDLRHEAKKIAQNRKHFDQKSQKMIDQYILCTNKLAKAVDEQTKQPMMNRVKRSLNDAINHYAMGYKMTEQDRTDFIRGLYKSCPQTEKDINTQNTK